MSVEQFDAVGIGAPVDALELPEIPNIFAVYSTNEAPGVFASIGVGSQSPLLHSHRARGTVASPSSPLSGDRILDLGCRAWFNGSFAGSSFALLTTLKEDVTSAYTPCFHTVEGTKTGTGTRNEWARWDEGNLDIGTSGSGYRLCVQGEGSQRIFAGQTSNPSVAFYSCRANNTIYDGENTSVPAVFAFRKLDNGRSINCAGTVNTAGTDYAEIEALAPDCVQPVPGQIVGFDRDGRVTDLWESSVSFAVVSSDPSFVGGDTFGPDDGTAHIAYCGKVPVNIWGAKPGQYIIPVRNGDGIGGKAVRWPLWRIPVGHVRRVLKDGRAEIAV